MCYCIVLSSLYAVVMGRMFYIQGMFYVEGVSTNLYCICLSDEEKPHLFMPWPAFLYYVFTLHVRIFNCFSAAELTLSSLTLASRTATTLSVTWSAGYPKCYSFTVSHSTQDGSITVTVTQPADSDTSHTLTSLQPGTTYRIEVEAVRKGDRADGQRAKVMDDFMTEEGEE